METITSRQNPLMTHIRRLAGSAAYRRQTGQCLCDSPKLLREAAQWGAEVHQPRQDPPGGAIHLPRAGFAGAGNASGPALCGAGRGPGPRQRGNGAADAGRL